MSDIAIRAANLDKLYHLGRGQGNARYRTLRESMMDWAKAPLRATEWGNWQKAGFEVSILGAAK